MVRVAIIVVALLNLTPRRGLAQGIVLESYSGRRLSEATQLLAPLTEELAARGYAVGDTLTRKYEARISKPAVTAEGLSPDFEDAVERGHKAWIAGQFDVAVATLAPLITAAHANSAVIAQNQPKRDKLQKALVALALSQQRKGDLAAAEDAFREILRSFPDVQLSRSAYGPDAYKLFEQVRRATNQGGRGRLTINVPSDQAVVFLNERFEKVGRVSKGDLLPGEYRVYLQIGKQVSRVHHVMVQADDETVLSIDLRHDTALRTSSAWIGFEFASAADREASEARFAVRAAKALGATAVVVVGVDYVRGRPSLVGSLVDLATAREIRRASLALDPAPGVERVRALARFLGGDTAAAGLEVEIGEPPAPLPATVDEPPERTAGPRWMRWTGVAALGLGVVSGGLAYKFVRDGRAAGDELDRVCAVTCTSEQARDLQSQQTDANRNAIVAGIAGGAAIVVGTVFLVLSRSRPAPSAVALVPTGDGFTASCTFAF